MASSYVNLCSQMKISATVWVNLSPFIQTSILLVKWGLCNSSGQFVDIFKFEGYLQSCVEKRTTNVCVRTGFGTLTGVFLFPICSFLLSLLLPSLFSLLIILPLLPQGKNGRKHRPNSWFFWLWNHKQGEFKNGVYWRQKIKLLKFQCQYLESSQVLDCGQYVRARLFCFLRWVRVWIQENQWRN